MATANRATLPILRVIPLSSGPDRAVATQGQRYPAEREPHNTDEPSMLEIRMRQILAEPDFPAISRDALEALKHMPDNDASLQRLATIVLREYSLTLKVLRTANSAYYKRSGQQIQSATHAMLLLGARTVRQLAGSLVVFENHRTVAPGLKELMLLSLLTANHAREVALRLGFADPEEAHLSGMFRNLGEVLVAGYFPREYARILYLVGRAGRSEALATFETLGFAYQELGEVMARHWGMPESVLAAIRADGPQAPSIMGAVACFAHELTHAVYRSAPDAQRDRATEVHARYARRLGLARDELGAVLAAALDQTRQTFSSAKVTLEDLRLRRQVEGAMAALGASASEPLRPEGAELEAPPDDTALERLRGQFVRAVDGAARPDSGHDVSKVILMVLEAIHRGGPFERVVFCVLTPDRATVKARFGLGPGGEGLLERFTFDLSPREGPVAVAMLRRQSVYAPVERDFTAQELRFAQSLGASSFGVFPVVVAARLVGCVYCDRPWNARPPDKPTLAFVRAACDAATRGIEARQGTAPRPGLPPVPAPRSPTPAYSVNFKRDVVMRLLRGEPMADLGAELGVPLATLEMWRTDFLSAAVTGLKAG
jgi:HD-like signal output (HDOD) protein